MSSGDIFHFSNAQENIFLLQLGEITGDPNAPFVVIGFDVDEQATLGCHNKLPAYLIKKSTAGTFPYQDALIPVRDPRLLLVATVEKLPVVKTLSPVQMEHLKKCAEKHKQMPLLYFKYFVV